MCDIVDYNKYLFNQYKISNDIKIFEKYVISELLPPIGDYINAVKLIRENYSKFISFKLLIVGAYISSEWHIGENEMLDILNKMCEYLSPKYQSMVWWLNAHHLQFYDRNFESNKDYKRFLLNSVECDKSGVFNLLALARIDKKECKYTGDDILKNIHTINNPLDENSSMTLEQCTDPTFYIEEHIWGTNITDIVYNFVLNDVRKYFN